MVFIKNFLSVFFCIILVPGILSAGTKKDRYIINPTVSSFDSFPSFPNAKRWFVGSVENLVTGQDSGIIGYTRTGIKTKAPVICSPSLEKVFRNSLFNLFSDKKVVSLDASAADFLIRVKILDFYLIEKSSFLTQTINAKIKLEVTQVDPFDTTRVLKFVVDSENSQTALDTSNYAESITRDILSSALKEIWKTLNR
ncbi:MAG: hypothetical protein GX267_04465 [Fibrobacter sp.]|mgnify:CR=1 FL=1|jgi:hypothetical protein|nr:hypothetical protein [Fibrobacter sp.]